MSEKTFRQAVDALRERKTDAIAVANYELGAATKTAMDLVQPFVEPFERMDMVIRKTVERFVTVGHGCEDGQHGGKRFCHRCGLWDGHHKDCFVHELEAALATPTEETR